MRDIRIESAAFEPVKPALREKTRDTREEAPRQPKRDRADFDRRLIAYARAAKSKAEGFSPASKAKVEPGVTSDEIQAEIDRLKNKAEKPAESAETAQSAEDSAAKPADSKEAEALREQIKAVSELLAEKSNGLSAPVTRQLEKICSLLHQQEKTDPNTVSEELQSEIDKLSTMLSPEKNKTDKSDKTNKSDESDDKKKSLTELLEEQKNRLDKLFNNNANNADTDNTIGGIKNKLRQGRILTAYEQQLLSAKDPAAYESYQRIHTARRMFRCTLNSCRTRDDVIGMRLSNALSALSSYRKAIREGGDGGEVIALNAAFEDELRSFAKSSGYRSLPTAAECSKFDRDMAKARRYEQEKRLEKRREQLRLKRNKKKAKKTPGDGKRTVAQVLADPTSRKVLASRAKRTYCTCGVGFSTYKMKSKA